MSLEVTFVGSGGAFSRRFGHTNAWVEAGDTRLMIDFGYQTPARIEAMGRSLNEITAVAVSHLHADHTGGLEELAFRRFFPNGTRPLLLVPAPLVDPLWSHSLRGGLEWLADAQGEARHCNLETFFELLPLSAAWHRCGDLEIRSFAVDHVPGKVCFAFVVRRRGSREQAIFGCDTRGLIRELQTVPLAPDFRLGPVFHDVDVVGQVGGGGIHTPLDLLRDYPASVRERIVLTHYLDAIEPHEERLQREGWLLVRPDVTLRWPDWRQRLRSSQSGDGR